MVKEKTCLNVECSKPLTKKHSRKYCSSSCAAVVNNSKYPKRTKLSIDNQKGKSSIEKTCEWCQKVFYPWSVSSGKFCSRQCFSEHRRENYIIPKFLSGELTDSKSIKNCLILLRKNICVVCGNNGTHNNMPLVLHVDHIDGNSDNNQPDNLRLICPNCHTQTPNYGSKGARRTTARRASRKRNHYYKQEV
jgi:5-methylcytosine-specific restriction endonuclease McrA